MTNTLYDLFHNYISVFQLLIEKHQENKNKVKCFEITAGEREKLLFFVNEAEGKREFEEIVKITDFNFPNYNEWGVGENSVHNFFCNSGFYIDLFKGKTPDNNKLYDSYCKEFKKKDYNIKLFVMMEFIGFAEESMGFDSFQIRKFSTKELNTILRNEINEIFFPRAYIDVSELNKFEKYYFIYLSAPCDIVRPDRFIYPSGVPEPVPRNYSDYPKALETILKYLTLFDWKHTPDGWMLSSHGFNFNIPVFLQISENLLYSPTTIPDFSPLETTPVLGSEDVNEPIEIPDIRFDFDRTETIQFRKFINNVKNILDNLSIEGNNWEFIDVAQEYLIKAFFFEGLEQLLWHIVVIDALFGERGVGGHTKRMKNRIRAILGRSKSEEFDELYGFRCSLVHGDKFDNQIFTKHLYKARQLARELLLWFLNFLSAIQNNIDQPNCNKYSRKNLLKSIDHAEDIKSSKNILDIMPKGFPRIPEWIK